MWLWRNQVWQKLEHLCLASTHTICAYCLRFTDTALRCGPAERDPLSNQKPSLGMPAGSAETEVTDAAVPVESIKRQLVLEEISRSGEMGGTTYRCLYFLY